MAATMDDKTPCRKLINCIFNRFFYGFDFGFISWICSSHLNNKYKLFHSWLVYIVLFKAAPKRVSLVFSRLTFLCNNSPASPLWNFPEARNRKGTGRAYKWGKYVMLIREGPGQIISFEFITCEKGWSNSLFVTHLTGESWFLTDWTLSCVKQLSETGFLLYRRFPKHSVSPSYSHWHLPDVTRPYSLPS